MIQLLNNGTTLIPSDHIHIFEDRTQANANTEMDIYGSPVVILKEESSGVMGWTLGASYLPLDVCQACIDAYDDNAELTLTDELGVSTTVNITDYPDIERLKSLDGVIYNVKLTLAANNSTFGVPAVLSTDGPRLFGR